MPLSSQIPPPYLDELLAAWAADQRLPSVESRRAWCSARQLDYDFVNRAFWWRKRDKLRRAGRLTVPVGSYELPVGMKRITDEDLDDLDESSDQAQSQSTELILYPPTPTPSPPPSSDPVSDDSSLSWEEPEPEYSLYPAEECNKQDPMCGDGFTCDLCATCHVSPPAYIQDYASESQKLEALYPFYCKAPKSEEPMPWPCSDHLVLWDLSAIPFEIHSRRLF